MYAALSKHKTCLSLTAIRKKIIPQVVAQVRTLCRYQQCASQQRNGHLGHDDKYLIWFIKEVEGFTRPHQTDLRTDIYVFIYTEAARSISSYFQSKDYKTFFFFFNPNILKPLFSVKNLAILSRRGGGGNARGAARRRCGFFRSLSCNPTDPAPRDREAC